jgi:hypothetical protein
VSDKKFTQKEAAVAVLKKAESMLKSWKPMGKAAPQARNTAQMAELKGVKQPEAPQPSEKAIPKAPEMPKMPGMGAMPKAERPLRSFMAKRMAKKGNC